jgi:hypothetical protein
VSLTAERLLALLPPIYRLRDEAQGGPLRALMTVIAEQVEVLEDDLEQLYDDHFIETCADWAVPYLGEMVGARLLRSAEPDGGSQRAEVADTLALRRRKGTAAVLEQLARNVTGWDAAAVEYFDRVAATQSLRHLRPHARTAELRASEPLEWIGTPFDRVPHTADVRRAARGGRYNLPNVGIFLFRLRAFALAGATPADEGDGRRFRFSPLGNDAPLYALPRPETDVAHLAGPANVPLPIRRREMHRRPGDFYAPGGIGVRENGAPVPLARVRVCDLSGWAALPDPWPEAGGEPLVLVDPELGRLAFAPLGVGEARAVEAGFRYGFGGELGGGGYERAATFTARPVDTVVSRGGDLDAVLQAAGAGGLVEVADSATYPLVAGTVGVDSGASLALRAADGMRPFLRLDGDLVLDGAASGADAPTEVTLNGVVIEGGTLRVRGGVRLLRLRHCTLVPGKGLNPDGSAREPGFVSLSVETPDARVEVERCILGAVRAVEGAQVSFRDSVVDAGSRDAVAYAAPDGVSPGGALAADETTVVGRVRTEALERASNSVFLARAGAGWPAPVESSRVQEGCVRFSFVPAAARVPRRHRCIPATAAEEPRVTPLFASLRYGDPDYALLSPRAPLAVRTGADDGSEMGAFHHQNQPRREANLRLRLDEYLRFGLEAGIFVRT